MIGGMATSFAGRSARERLHDEDLGLGSDGVGLLLAIRDRLVVNEDHHMFAERALFVKHVTARPRMVGEVSIERSANSLPSDVCGRTFEMALHIRREE
jgi:hypothetical protein